MYSQCFASYAFFLRCWMMLCDIKSHIYTYKRGVCVCPLFIGHTTFATSRLCLRVRKCTCGADSATRHLPLRGSASEWENAHAELIPNAYTTFFGFFCGERRNLHVTQAQFSVFLLLEGLHCTYYFLALMNSRRTRRSTYPAEERAELRREQDRRRHAERRSSERREQTDARKDMDRLRTSQARAAETVCETEARREADRERASQARAAETVLLWKWECCSSPLMVGFFPFFVTLWQ